MAAGIYNITVEQGADWSLLLTITDPAGDLLDLTGYSASMQVRSQQKDTNFLIELTDGNGRIELGGALGTVTLKLTAAETAALTGGGVYDLELTDAGGAVDKIIKGKFRLEKEVTR